MQPSRKQIQTIIIVVVVLLVAGGISFSVSEHVSYAEGLYRALYVMLAHHDNFQSDNWIAKITIIVLILASLLVIAYLIKILADYIIGLGDGLKRRQMKARAAKMTQHYIVCGLGRVGRQVARELENEHVPFVGMDRDEDKVREAIERGFTAMLGDSTREEVLRAAGIDRAAGIVVCLGDDSANLFVTLAARQINPHIFIVARANHTENRIRLERAGANRVAMPHQIGGFHMAAMMLRPNMVDFLEVLSRNDHANLQIAEFVVPQTSHLIGQTLGWLVNNGVDATVLAINNPDGQSRVNPASTEQVQAGDRLILMGTQDQLQQANAKI